MRFLIIDALYEQNIAQFYAARPDRKALPYKHVLAAMVQDSGVCAAWWLVNELNKISGVSARAIIANAPLLQKRWADEVGFRFKENDWFHKILLEQIRSVQPDVLVVFPTTLLRSGFIDQVKMACSQLQCAVAWDGVGAHSVAFIKEYDVVLSCLEHTTEFYRNHGKQAATLITGFDATVCHGQRGSELLYDTVFVGSVTLNTYDENRFQLLLEISRKRKVDLWMSNYPAWQPWSRNQLGLLRRFHYRQFREVWELGRRNHGQKFGKEMFSVLGQARICLNQHADFGNGRSAGNRRLWEATGMGACLLTDWQPNLDKIFKVDEEVVTYRTAEECIEKMDYLLAHEDKRKEIAAAGMGRTLKDYSPRQFAAGLLHQIQEIIKL